MVGIIRPNEEAAASMLTGSVGYIRALTQYVMEKTNESQVVTAQKEDETTDVFTGLPFLTEDVSSLTDEEKAEQFQIYLDTLTSSEKAEIYSYIQSIPDQSYVDQIVEQQLSGMTREQIEEQVTEQYAQNMGVDVSTVQSYIAEMDDETLFGKVEEALRKAVEEQYAQQVEQQLSSASIDQLALMLDNTQWTAEPVRDHVRGVYALRLFRSYPGRELPAFRGGG